MKIQNPSEKNCDNTEPLSYNEQQELQIQLKPASIDFDLNRTCAFCPRFCKASSENSKIVWLSAIGICFMVLTLTCILIFWTIVRNNSLGKLFRDIICIKLKYGLHSRYYDI